MSTASIDFVPSLRPKHVTTSGRLEEGVGQVAVVRTGRWRRWLRYWSLAVGYRCRLNYEFFKRLLDIVVAGAMLIMLLPLFAVVALLVKLNDGGPVLFWQTRVGRWGRTFGMPKFRSMVPNAERLLPALLKQNECKDGVIFKMKSDPRVTWIGRFIRRFSIDELPQLWCVLVGDMSLVGPRPPLPREVVLYSLAHRQRLEVVPGLTCIWQVSGRSLLPFATQVEMDVEYAEKQNFWFDLQLLFRTIPAVLFPEGAY